MEAFILEEAFLTLLMYFSSFRGPFHNSQHLIEFSYYYFNQEYTFFCLCFFSSQLQSCFQLDRIFREFNYFATWHRMIFYWSTYKNNLHIQLSFFTVRNENINYPYEIMFRVRWELYKRKMPTHWASLARDLRYIRYDSLPFNRILIAWKFKSRFAYTAYSFSLNFSIELEINLKQWMPICVTKMEGFFRIKKKRWRIKGAHGTTSNLIPHYRLIVITSSAAMYDFFSFFFNNLLRTAHSLSAHQALIRIINIKETRAGFNLATIFSPHSEIRWL